jgi:hypothetical protein
VAVRDGMPVYTVTWALAWYAASTASGTAEMAEYFMVVSVS